MVERHHEGTDGTTRLSDDFVVNNRFWSAQYHRDQPEVSEIQGYVVSQLDDGQMSRLETMLARQEFPRPIKMNIPLNGSRPVQVEVQCIDVRRLDRTTLLCRFKGQLHNSRREWEMVAA